MSDTVDMNALLKGFLDKGGILVTGNNNTVVVGNYFAGSSATTTKEKATRSSTTVQEDEFTVVNPRTDVQAEDPDLNRDSADTTATPDDKVKAEEIVRKLEVLDEEEDEDGDATYFTSDILYDAGDQGFDLAEKIIKIGLNHFDGLDISVANSDAVNAVLKKHYDDKK